MNLTNFTNLTNSLTRKLKNYRHLLQSFVYNLKYGFPAKELIIIGVTGTDGKTTTTSMIYHILKESGLPVGMVSTITAKAGKQEIDTGLHVTTPEPWDVPRILRRIVKEGIKYVVLESTSSGLDQNRLFGVEFDASVITHIGHDHLDYHRTWGNYAKAKFKIIGKTKADGLVVLNKDHESYEWIEKEIKRENSKVKSIECKSIENLSNRKHSIAGISFDFGNLPFEVPIIGEHNFMNALQAITVCERYISLDQIRSALATFQTPLGRMQVMQEKPFGVIIDFAHTPDSLEKALESVNKVKPTSDSKIICIFGCAGERDHGRRRMGEVSAKLADITIVSLEDPRSEDIKVINDEILEYAYKTGKTLTQRFPSHENYISSAFPNGAKREIFSFDYADVQNRIDAIDLAFKLARPNDVVFITGKGHERSLAIGNPTVEYPYTDQETVAKFIT